LIGEFDLLIQVWLPVTSTQEHFEKEVRAALKGDHINLMADTAFAVRSILLHWAWNGPGGALREPSPEVLERRLSSEKIKGINALDDYSDLPKAELQKLQHENLISLAEPADGVRFFTAISTPAQDLNSTAREELENRLRGVFLDAGELISEPSIYGGAGFGQYLLSGKVPCDRFYDITQKVIEQINSTGVQAFFGVRTHTQLSGTPAPLFFEDDLPLDVPAQPSIALEGLFTGDEGQNLEIKGSLMVDVKRWLRRGEVVREDKILREGVLKAIVGFLNASGGTVVVGALEKSRFSDYLDKQLAEYPSSGNYKILGLDLDYEAAGRGRGWDAIELQLRNVLGSGIEPAPTVWVSIRRESFRGQNLCVISVAEPDRGWFYLRDGGRLSFYVRQGNQTTELLGAEADTYKAVKSRG
jgi:hypothetical protein